MVEVVPEKERRGYVVKKQASTKTKIVTIMIAEDGLENEESVVKIKWNQKSQVTGITTKEQKAVTRTTVIRLPKPVTERNSMWVPTI